MKNSSESETTMASITVRRLDDSVMERLKQSAQNHGRSTEAEVRSILEDYTAGYVAHGIVTAGDFFAQIRADLDGGLQDGELETPRCDDGPRPADISDPS